MATGHALIVGVPQPSPSSGWSAKWLPGVLNDVASASQLLGGLGFATQVHKSEAGRANTVLAGIRSAASALSAGDMFVFYYAGHGAQKTSADGDEAQDQLLLTFDRPIVDDELGACWALFRKHVRIVVITDSCHSGSAVRALDGSVAGTGAIGGGAMIDPIAPLPPRLLSIGLTKVAGGEVVSRDGNIEGLQGSLLHMAACQDWEQAMDLGNHGAFTDALLIAWNAGFRASYDQLFAEIRHQMQATTAQAARMTTYGFYQKFFLAQKPLTPNIAWPPI
jgi:hypothetical protein